MNQTKQTVLATIDAKAQGLIDFANQLFGEAEAGYEEHETAKKVAAWMKGLSLSVTEGLAVTGVKAVLDTGRPGPTVALIGELDGILCPSHPQANQQTGGMSHSCGHHAQVNAVLAAAEGLCAPGVREQLCGKIVFFFVPAEEYVPLERRCRLIDAGKISRCSGKSELLCLGEFDDVDLALTTHAHMVEHGGSDLLLGNSRSTGTFTKRVTLKGRSAHAAAAPHDGLNALSAATLGLTAIGMLRETFRECDCVRVHTNVTHGGDAINVVPDRVCVEGMVRASNLPALEKVSAQFDRAFEGAALSLGATAQTETWQGYLPCPFIAASQVQRRAAQEISERENAPLAIADAQESVQNYASTDVGDLAQVLPVVNFTHGGTVGSLHSRDFAVVDARKALIVPGMMMAMTVCSLLEEQGAAAKALVAAYQPTFTREEYRAYVAQFR